MNYNRIYEELIGSRKASMTPDSYHETHHIVPRCMGGSFEPSNLVKLTAREHFIAHALLCKMYPDNPGLASAMTMMCADKTGNRNRNRLYDHHRKMFARANSIFWKNYWKTHKHPKGFKNKKHMNETKKRMAESSKNCDYTKSIQREIHRFSLQGEYIDSFGALNDAAKAVGAKSASNIKYTADGKFQYAHGFRWSYDRNAKFEPIAPRKYKGNRGKIKITNGLKVRMLDSDAVIPHGWYRVRK